MDAKKVTRVFKVRILFITHSKTLHQSKTPPVLCCFSFHLFLRCAVYLASSHFLPLQIGFPHSRSRLLGNLSAFSPLSLIRSLLFPWHLTKTLTTELNLFCSWMWVHSHQMEFGDYYDGPAKYLGLRSTNKWCVVFGFLLPSVICFSHMEALLPVATSDLDVSKASWGFCRPRRLICVRPASLWRSSSQFVLHLHGVSFQRYRGALPCVAVFCLFLPLRNI